MLLMILSPVLIATHTFGSTNVRCKYSVRDVAFVNVHGKPWQLQLIKPNDIEPKVFSRWNDTLRAKLQHSNVGYIWLEKNSDEARQWLKGSDMERLVPPMALIDSRGNPVEISNAAGTSFDESLDVILSSPVRDRILEQVVDSLCVFVLIESGDERLDAQARKTVNAAVEQMKKQMWMLEKPSENGPAMVAISNEEKDREAWFLQSIGVGHSPTPSVAIIFGQGRRLGEVLVGDDINLKLLVSRASICGQDCECDLNRDWLYGIQMIHVWSKQRERAAESSLSFDPNSAFVIAEVAQIIQKNSVRNVGQNSGRPPVNLGSGLIIHDLEPSSNSREDQPIISDAAASGQTDDANSAPEKELPVEQLDGGTATDPAPGISIPWSLFVALGALLILVFAIKFKR